jgi:hypothetical protein
VGEQAQGLEYGPEEELLMNAMTPIRWVSPYRTSRAAMLPASAQPKPGRTTIPSTAKRGPARLPNPEREVVTGAKLHDVLRW